MNSKNNGREQRAETIATQLEELTGYPHPTDQELQTITELTREGEKLAGEITRDKIRANTARGWSESGSDTVNVKRHVDPWTSTTPTTYEMPVNRWEHTRNHQELRDRALSALDERVSPGFDELPVHDKDRERLDGLLRDEDKDSDLAAYVIAASRPEYHTAFNKLMTGRSIYLSDGERAALQEVERTRIRREAGEGRSALSTTSASAMIPFFLDPSWIITGSGALSPFRQICSVETIPTNIWHGVAATQLVAEWTSELSEMTSAEPTITGPSITPQKADMYLESSWEALGDSDVAAQLGAAFSDGKNVHETSAFTNGNGTTQPRGIVTVMQQTTASRVASTTNAQFGAVDVFALVSNLPARFQDRASWIGHWGIFNVIRQMSPSGTGSNFWLDLGAGFGDGQQLLGAPAYRVSAMQSSLSAATASNDDGVLILGDFSRMKVIDRVGLEVITTPVFGSNRRPVGATGFTAWWRVGSDVTDANAFRGVRC